MYILIFIKYNNIIIDFKLYYNIYLCNTIHYKSVYTFVHTHSTLYFIIIITICNSKYRFIISFINTLCNRISVDQLEVEPVTLLIIASIVDHCKVRVQILFQPPHLNLEFILANLHRLIVGLEVVDLVLVFLLHATSNMKNKITCDLSWYFISK